MNAEWCLKNCYYDGMEKEKAIKFAKEAYSYTDRQISNALKKEFFKSWK